MLEDHRLHERKAQAPKESTQHKHQNGLTALSGRSRRHPSSTRRGMGLGQTHSQRQKSTSEYQVRVRTRGGEPTVTRIGSARVMKGALRPPDKTRKKANS